MKIWWLMKNCFGQVFQVVELPQEACFPCPANEACPDGCWKISTNKVREAFGYPGDKSFDGRFSTLDARDIVRSETKPEFNDSYGIKPPKVGNPFFVGSKRDW